MAGKSKGKGGKNRRRGKNHNLNTRELQVKDDTGQEYGTVLKMLGSGRVECLCYDGEKRLCHIRGTMRKKVWIVPGDIVLVSLCDFQEERGDIIIKYTADEARQLKQIGELPENVTINEEAAGHGGHDVVRFGIESSDEENSGDDVKDKVTAPVLSKLAATGEAPKFRNLQCSSRDEEDDSELDIDNI